ncbi:hypothetical protein LTR99_008935 [Exophiala xenobiotica]|uniref:Uncharacterized protein n=1 Tax=Vermiconidia calcicola TaxID=1690605 RepID=A0AAV9PQX1_9PEZI|nr:hypothetical protein LTR92_011224 [Exophiala xenobiotica]KAK5527666.1 hypothetical protein LTR25_010989 [Vermiconidia calcicola]KAK5531544.1 hypothetical protein LTR23_009960 [Chaetothyriales sp. CCFEE 6169]KAK5202484.1 hypothetical protein LTR41_011766 [Exophiala xenobiotica]KAK5215208.1 hypothetical protein LTR72_011723 [Exophiala xenobiotica]
MALDRPLEPAEMWQSLQDLHDLCVQDLTVLYLPRSRPIEGACPVKFCQIQLEKTSDDEFTLDAAFSDVDASHPNGGVAHTVEAEDLDGDSEFNTLFDQYLRSPTGSPSPFDSASELSGTTLARSDSRSSCILTNVSKRAEENERTEPGPRCDPKRPPRIRLQVRQAKIILSLKLPRQAEGGRPPSRKVPR